MNKTHTFAERIPAGRPGIDYPLGGPGPRATCFDPEPVQEKDGTPLSAALNRLDGRQNHLSNVLTQLMTRLENAGLLAPECESDCTAAVRDAPLFPIVSQIDALADFTERQSNRISELLRRLAV